MSEEKKEVEKEEIVLPYSIQLKYPLKFGDAELKELVVERRLRAGDYKGIPASGLKYDDIQRLISRMVGQPVSTIEKLDSLDMFTCVEVLDNFLPGGLRTGDSR